jgi:hypothetical protein
MTSVQEIVRAIHALPRPDRLKLVEQLTEEINGETLVRPGLVPEEDSHLELRNGFYVYTGPVDVSALDHRLGREERIDQLMESLGADRH